MDDASGGPFQRFLVVTGSAVVGEDLREILANGSDQHVDVRQSLSDPWEGPYTAAFFSVGLEEMLTNQRVKALQMEGTQLVILNGHRPEEEYHGTGIIVLDQPFRTEDVEDLLSVAGIGAHR